MWDNTTCLTFQFVLSVIPKFHFYAFWNGGSGIRQVKTFWGLVVLIILCSPYWSQLVRIITTVSSSSFRLENRYGYIRKVKYSSSLVFHVLCSLKPTRDFKTNPLRHATLVLTQRTSIVLDAFLLLTRLRLVKIFPINTKCGSFLTHMHFLNVGQKRPVRRR